MNHSSSAFGIVLATVALVATSAVPAAFAGRPDFATARLRQTAGNGSAPEATGQVFRDCNDGCPRMVVIPAGRFLMGSELYEREQPQHPVRFDAAIAVSIFETTFDEWDACVRGGGCVHNSTPSDEGWGRGRRPVINVSWNDAKDYVSWLSRKTGKTYRLLTEAEWEPPREQARRQPIPGAIRSTAVKQVTTADEARTAQRTPAGFRCAERSWSGPIPPTAGVFTTCSEMSGNGVRTTGTLITMGHQVTARRGVAEMRPCASCAAEHGITAQAGFALPIETGFLPTVALPLSASVLQDSSIRSHQAQKCRV